MQTHESTTAAPDHQKLLIASQQSRFKSALVAGIRDGLTEKAVAIRTIDIRHLGQEDASIYNGILLVNKCMAGRPDPRVEAFIDNFPDKHKLIVLTTGARDSWSPKTSDVDAMTSASVLSEAPILSSKIVDKINALLRLDAAPK